jgi:hypothetical protein
MTIIRRIEFRDTGEVCYFLDDGQEQLVGGYETREEADAALRAQTPPAKMRTITLTDRAPVKIREDEWPILAEASDDDYRGDPARRYQAANQGDIESWWLKVRQHADGRLLVYGGVEASRFTEGREDWRGGELLAGGCDVAAAIRRVGEAGQLPDAVIRACIADLPAEEV